MTDGSATTCGADVDPPGTAGLPPGSLDTLPPFGPAGIIRVDDFHSSDRRWIVDKQT
jgi:hypothetical protein